MRLTIVYAPPEFTSPHRYALDEQGRWWTDEYDRGKRWQPVRLPVSTKPLRADRLGPPAYGVHDGPWVVAA